MSRLQELELTPMTTAELATYLEHAQDGYARQRVEFGGQTETQARAAAEQSFDELFPGGTPADDQYLYVARDSAGGRVGALWLAIRVRNEQRYAWIYDIEVDVDRRRQGWGRALLAYAEQWALDREIPEIELNVFGANTGARHLYADVGYIEQAVTMAKRLTPVL